GQPFRFSKDPENPKNKSAADNYVKPGEAGPLRPSDAARSFTVFDDLELEQVLAEPIVRQPLQLSWDERGRLWVVQYIQYPAPAGLTLVSRDNWWRAVYDKVPPPPPHHFKGEDKITIHEDTDGDGKFDKHTTFIEGLSIATSIAHGRGGVWVLNPPYLVFFSDTNHDDIVDSDPIVHLAGFGLEDTHSVANSLRWGPDGWLYGCHGSTVTANIIRPGLDEKPIARIMGQAIWRYHPETRRFEVFAEGGGNAFGLEMDDKARIFSGHNGGDTRGFYYPQGGYLQKGFEKHGPLSNPYAFGYFKQMPHNAVQRFTHTFVLYGGGAFPEKYDGELFGAEPLQGRIVLSHIESDGSSFKTHDLGYAVTSSDKYFRPVDIKVGPDGAIYVADWYDRQVTHTHNYEGNIDKSNGRIYRLKKKDAAPPPKFDWSQATGQQLASLLRSSNRWTRQTALRLIGDRHDKNFAPVFHQLCLESSGQLALEALWASHLSGGLDDAMALALLDHKDSFVRLWTIRLLGDENHLTQSINEKVQRLALSEPNVEVRSQLASTAKLLPAPQGLPLARNLLARDEDANDVHLPLQLWWAIESKAESDREVVLTLFNDPTLWNYKIVRTTILDRLMKRYAMAGTQPDLLACARLLRLAPQRADAKLLLNAFEDAFKGRSLGVIPPELQDAIAQLGGESMALALRRGNRTVLPEALKLVNDPSTPKPKRIQLIQVFGDVSYPEAASPLVEIAKHESDPALRKEAISALQIYDDPKIASEIIPLMESLPADAKLAAFNLLASRRVWASLLVKAVEQADVPAKSVPGEIVDKLRLDESLASTVDQVFGPKVNFDKAAVDSRMKDLEKIIQSGNGDPFEGFKHFNLACSTCHTLFGKGGQIGPDLTSYKRDDLESMLMNIVNPSGEIREGYETVVIETKDGR
ncbi:MAG TPA: PVC-type heme-binding CxxCH protein, partial [Verrucomicrobiae bacterium]|nr:PVC-type heme-binding CxxCH protein [Verrucomicrobiae bacterium]